jgi:hypothetical protein
MRNHKDDAMQKNGEVLVSKCCAISTYTNAAWYGYQKMRVKTARHAATLLLAHLS